MCCARDNLRRRAFTLIEVMLAVAVMALVVVAICRFVETVLQSIRISTEDTSQKGSMLALEAVLQEEFSNLPPLQTGELLGEAHKFNGKESDQIEWLTQAGNGLFTQAAEGPWKATLALRPDDNTNTYTLGLLRKVPDNSSTQEHWLPLLPRIDAIEIRYFNQRLNVWLDNWNDSQSLPSLVRIRIWRKDQPVPYETVIELPPSQLPS